ncbi:putative cyclase-domain-containing protein [Spinellus fusiger]|nr:putative cyclase-domain-containing protein [Spinellus fusiger]
MPIDRINQQIPLPSFDELPLNPEDPPYTAWSLWGKDDNLGTLNKLTPDKIIEAGKLVRKGKVFSLNWALELPDGGMVDRFQSEHIIKTLSENKCFDDVYHNFNPQASSQWDGLRHHCHLSTSRFYNNTPLSEVNTLKTGRLGIHHVARRGIVGRAVLLDFGRWAATHIKDYDPFSPYEILVEDLERVARHQNVEIKEGDILLLRTGWTTAYEKRKAEGIMIDLSGTMEKLPNCVGIKACEETFRWLWNHHFSAVASDNIGFEKLPFPTDREICHSVLLGGWGMLIGELWFLDDLAEDSAKDGVYEYFFTSAPLNKFGGIASPPNAICTK